MSKPLTEEQKAEFFRDLNSKFEPQPVQPVGTKQIASGVFFGLLMFAVVVVALYAALH
jgi:hypothetical protein